PAPRSAQGRVRVHERPLPVHRPARRVRLHGRVVLRVRHPHQRRRPHREGPRDRLDRPPRPDRRRHRRLRPHAGVPAEEPGGARAGVASADWHFIDTSPARTQLPLDRYEARLGEGKVATATLLDKDHEVHGTLTDGTNYTVKFPDGYTEQLTKNIVASKAKFDVDS